MADSPTAKAARRRAHVQRHLGARRKPAHRLRDVPAHPAAAVRHRARDLQRKRDRR